MQASCRFCGVWKTTLELYPVVIDCNTEMMVCDACLECFQDEYAYSPEYDWVEEVRAKRLSYTPEKRVEINHTLVMLGYDPLEEV